MSYLVFARKFRPQQFDEVVGQDAVTTTLKNAIAQERIPQSFLFSGPRGTGKTSVARILAKALNCEKPPLEKCGGKCESCKEITEGRSLDVLEIDGASNRGIDEIRTLRETVKFKPARGKYKIYIIDEVHMLTTEAFNALLKTLEEPPVHVKFIFATTEPHRVPLTILSRCQRFNFRRIPAVEIAAKLEEIAKKEKIKFEKKALYLIARASDGGLRDAESLLDQMASFCAEGIQEKEVLNFLGLASEAFYLDLLKAVHAKDAAVIFSQVKEFYEAGGDLAQLARGMLDTFRYLLLFQCAEDAAKWADLSAESAEALRTHKDDFTRAELLLALALLQNLQVQLRRNIAPPRLLVETALLKLLHLDGLKQVGEALQEGDGGPAPRMPDLVKVPAGPAAGWISRSAPVAPRPPATPKAETPAAVPRVKTEIGTGPVKHPEGPVPASNAATTQAPPDRLRHGAASGAPDFTQVSGAWPRIIDYVKSQRMSVGVFLSEAEPLEAAQTGVVLGLPAEFQFHKETLEKDANRRLIEEAFETVMGFKVRIQFVITQPNREERPAKPAPTPAPEPVDGPRQDILEEALNVFKGARLVRKE